MIFLTIRFSGESNNGARSPRRFLNSVSISGWPQGRMRRKMRKENKRERREQGKIKGGGTKRKKKRKRDLKGGRE